MSKLDGEIIKILAENSDPVSSAKLAELLDVSPRTIKRYIKMINEQDAIITSTKNGYLLEVSPAERESLVYDSKQNFNHLNQDIFYELFIHEFQTIDQISENTYYNRNTVSNALKGIRQVLEDYNLELKSENKKGLSIQGSEINTRQCMVENIDIDYYFYQKYKGIDQPKITGSLTLKIPGASPKRPILLYCLCFTKKAMIKTTTKVEPEPPKLTVNVSINDFVTI